MSEISILISQAVERAESGLSQTRFLDPSSPTFDYALTQAWDQLQTAAKLLEQVRWRQSQLARA